MTTSTDKMSHTIEAPAKINLSLEVLGRRADGFHEIRSLMITVGLFDRLELSAAPPGSIELVCDDPALPTDRSNLVVRAAERLAREINRPVGARMALHKRIPIGAGLGGGSSDAAAALVGLNRLWAGGLDSQTLAAIGLELGSDIPFFFGGPASIVGGRGEVVRSVRMRWQGWVVLVSAGVQVSTEQVYGRWQPQLASAASESPAEQLTERQSAAALGALLRNDLESAVFAVSPGVKRMRDDLVAMGLANARVTGAGSVVYGVFDRRAEAEAFAEKVDLNMPSRTCFVAPAPCPST